MSHAKIGGFPTHDLWKICKQRGINKSTKKTQNCKVKDPGTTSPIASPLEPQQDFTSGV